MYEEFLKVEPSINSKASTMKTGEQRKKKRGNSILKDYTQMSKSSEQNS
jgi:hypothetical protein